MKRLFFFLVILFTPSLITAQVAVAPLAIPRAQFLSSTGIPLAGGCVNFFTTGTSTPQAIYADSGGVNQLPNPLTLDAAGEASVWMSNIGYDIVMNTGVPGTACSVSLGTQLWKEINKNPFSIINNGSNFIIACATSDPAGVPGELGCRSDLGNKGRYFSNLWDSIVTENDIATITNKTLTAPVINNAASGSSFIAPVVNGLTIGGVSVTTGNPTNFVNFTNGAAGTTLNQLAKLVVNGSGVNAVSTAITDIGGVVGVTVAGAGASGIDIVQRTGQVLCVFDASTTANDYVIISSTIVGNCHDAGTASYPSGSAQVIGRVLTTNVGAGTYLIDLFPPEIHSGGSASIACTNFTPVTITNNNALQNLLSCTVSANTLAQGSMLAVDLVGIESTASAQSIAFTASLGGGTVGGSIVSLGVANNQPIHLVCKFIVLTAGAGGTGNWACEAFGSGINISGNNGVVGTPTISINTTISNSLLITEQMSVANAGNTITGQLLKAVVY